MAVDNLFLLVFDEVCMSIRCKSPFKEENIRSEKSIEFGGLEYFY